MFTSEQALQLAELFKTAQSALIVLPPQANLDQIATGLALAASLEVQNKQVQVVAPEAPSPELTQLRGMELIQTKLGNRDLTISFAYQPEAVDKVSYHIDDQQQRFNLVIKPKKGFKPLDRTGVDFSYTGAEADLIFLVGVHELESLEHLYFGFEQVYQSSMVVTFHTFEPGIGTFKLDASGTSSLSESMTLLLQSMGYSVPPDAATNLLAAIEAATNSFQSLAASAETFEIVAWLLRSGARRTHRAAAQNSVVQPQRQALPQSQSVQLQPQQDQISLSEAMSTQSVPQQKPKHQNQRRKNNRPSASSKNQAPKAGSLQHQPTGFGPGGGG